MKTKREHHFVPKGYLRLFGINHQQIRLYNVEKRLYVGDAPIKGQCSRHNFYGDTDELENHLQDIDGRYATLLREIIRVGRLPAKSSADYNSLLFLVALQKHRTRLNYETHREQREKFYANITQTVPEEQIAPNVLEPLNAPFRPYWLSILLKSAEMGPEYLADLDAVLLCANKEQSFITSDAPVFNYCSFKEGMQVGLGLVSVGLQIFFPISPKFVLYIFDSNIYKARRDGMGRVRDLLEEDVDTLNALQIVGCSNNVYFSPQTNLSRVEALVEATVEKRPKSLVSVEEFVEQEPSDPSGKTRSSLVVSSYPPPKVGLRLEFSFIKKELRKIPMDVRVSEMTFRFIPSGERHRIQRSSGQARAFIRKEQERS